MIKRIPKIIDNSNHYHLWTDVLHARALAHQADNKWDSAAYVRWTLIIGWIALEIACQDALEEPKISYSFKSNLNEAITKKGLKKINWGQGIWQKVSELQEVRKNFVHRFISEKNLFPNPTIADDAVNVLREAIKDIYLLVGKTHPGWIIDDYDRGWSKKNGFQAYAYLTKIHSGADKNNENSIKVAFIDNRGEHLSDILPPDKSYQDCIDDLIENSKEPISSIRIYRGKTLIEERKYPMRGI